VAIATAERGEDGHLAARIGGGERGDERGDVRGDVRGDAQPLYCQS
jgi:hypothetical protein